MSELQHMEADGERGPFGTALSRMDKAIISIEGASKQLSSRLESLCRPLKKDMTRDSPVPRLGQSKMATEMNEKADRLNESLNTLTRILERLEF